MKPMFYHKYKQGPPQADARLLLPGLLLRRPLPPLQPFSGGGGALLPDAGPGQERVQVQVPRPGVPLPLPDAGGDVRPHPRRPRPPAAGGLPVLRAHAQVEAAGEEIILSTRRCPQKKEYFL